VLVVTPGVAVGVGNALAVAVGDAVAVGVGVAVGVALVFGDALAGAVGDAFGSGVGVEELLTPETTGETLPPPPPHPASNDKRKTTDAGCFNEPRNRMIATPNSEKGRRKRVCGLAMW
jgi:hypothetical protein